LEKYSNNEKYTAVIVEPREHNALEFVLNNFLTNLSDSWNIIIFHGTENINYINNIIDNNLSEHKKRITLVNLNIKNLNSSGYSKLLVQKDFYNHIPTEIFLVFQTDSIICPEYKDLINKFIKYDYVGAPLAKEIVGNGGLSLRRKSKMLEIIDKCKYTNQPEDIFFCMPCNEVSLNKPSYEEAKEFGVEIIYHPNSFGVHKLWRLKKDDIVSKNKYCTGVKKLIELNGRKISI